jgi:hypothetical protein
LLVTLITGVVLVWQLSQFGIAGSGGAIGVTVAAAWIIVAREYWVRWYHIIMRNMLRNNFESARHRNRGINGSAKGSMR